MRTFLSQEWVSSQKGGGAPGAHSSAVSLRIRRPPVQGPKAPQHHPVQHSRFGGPLGRGQEAACQNFPTSTQHTKLQLPQLTASPWPPPHHHPDHTRPTPLHPSPCHSTPQRITPPQTKLLQRPTSTPRYPPTSPTPPQHNQTPDKTMTTPHREVK